jgi:hypothetical protein
MTTKRKIIPQKILYVECGYMTGGGGVEVCLTRLVQWQNCADAREVTQQMCMA